MNLTLPVYIERSPRQTLSPAYRVRPLFFENPIVEDNDLRRALAKFVKAARKTINAAAKQRDQREIAQYTLAPDIEERRLSLTLDLKNRRIECSLLFIVFDILGKRMVYTPRIRGRWFEIARGEDLAARAVEFLTDHFRGLEPAEVDQILLTGDGLSPLEAYTGLVEFRVEFPLVAPSTQEEFRAKLIGDHPMDGEWELQTVGQCLNEQYPEGLSRAIDREVELAELTRWLKSRDRRPILLVGPASSGKTALIEEYVYRQSAKRKAAYRNRNNVWLLDPQRLIAGMSYVGQWENRLLSIIHEAIKRKHILYFQDLIGLFKAGVSAQSNLNVARVLKPFIERREVRVLGEISPEGFRVLREQDRAFSDLFSIMPVRESTEDETRRMMLSVIRELEAGRQCRFEPDVLPTVLALTRSYQREAAFPGKAASALRRLAVKHRESQIQQAHAIGEFQARSGLSLSLLTDSRIEREATIAHLTESVKGQRAAVEACADVLSLAKSRLNDPNRPLASFLFLGPTGVGKTQCAKSLARLLFNSEERLIRFDMNEFLSPDAVSRLTGSFDHPEGLLTGAIRRQPFAVILFDEIEKAHPDVFNLLLQALGEGRLSDSLGRTSDFTQSIVIMTSNLGVKEAAGGLGFKSLVESEQSIYTQAAEKFFSPEFFNRIDRIIPFQRLERVSISEIARTEVAELLRRDGFARRKLALRIDSEALEQLIREGFDPQLGSRAMKRVIERRLAQPLARRLSTTVVSSPTVIEIMPGSPELRVELHELTGAEPRERRTLDRLLSDPISTLEKIDRFLVRMDPLLATLRPEGPISIDEVNIDHHRYFLLNDRVRALRHHCSWLGRRPEAGGRATTRLSGGTPRHDPPRTATAAADAQRDWPSLLRSENLSLFFRETSHLSSDGAIGTTKDEANAFRGQLLYAIREAAAIDHLLGGEAQASSQSCLIMLRAVASSFDSIARLTALYEDLFKGQFGFETKRLNRKSHRSRVSQIEWIYLHGRLAHEIARVEQGTHLFFEDGRNPTPVQVIMFPLSGDQRPRELVKQELQRFKRWSIHGLRTESPFPFDPVIRVYAKDEAGIPTATLDLGSGLSINRYPTAETIRTFITSEFALPQEFHPS
jgi:ATP-dependent Clp protease ATP-binding subunit ClpC